jgi:hypothetical protein
MRSIYSTLATFAIVLGFIAPTFAQTTNTASLGTNLIEMTYSSGEQPFLNIFKTGSSWGTTAPNGTRYDESSNVFQLDANGYPTSMNGIGPAAGLTFSEIDTLVLRGLTAPYYYPAGNYVFLYDGTGTFNFQFDTNNSNIVSAAPGRIVINVPSPSAGGIQIQLTSTGSGASYAKNFRFV